MFLRTVILIFFLNLGLAVWSQTPGRYVVKFKDKGSGFSLSDPEEFLSERAIMRRQKQNIPVDSLDLPVSQRYIDSLTSRGIPVVNRSKWFNSVTTGDLDSGRVQLLSQLSFVKELILVKPFITAEINGISGTKTVHSTEYQYGFAERQISIHNGELLHKSGYTGEGMQIAIIDAGFKNANTISAFDHLWNSGKILGTKDFVQPGSDIFDKASHGTLVLSVMGGYIPSEFTGTAPDASYWLLRSEDTGSEYPIEEYNWASAAEFADSAGADVINSSLGYSEFYDSVFNHTYADMDGHTTPVSKAANIAFSRGMLVVVSAGNNGDDPWRYISAPADADSILAVAAVDMNGIITGFSSRGPSSDNDIKPNISAIGGGTYIINTSGEIGQTNGTSLSAPVITGLAACLWQADPEATNQVIKKSIEESSDRFTSPDSAYGYGIPDFYKALIFLRMKDRLNEQDLSALEFFPNPYTEDPFLAFHSPVSGKGSVSVYNLLGSTVVSFTVPVNKGLNLLRIHELSLLKSGAYILELKYNGTTVKKKIVKF